MKPSSVRKVRRLAVAAGLGLITVVAAGPTLGARQQDPLLQPTPLVLKDGRIANVSIHVVPFAPGRAELAADAGARVAELTRAIGTDCFLTAQVIGHIDSSEVARDGTLDAHRLARARADAVQASLIGGGLPAKAIASVWDWQFMVRAPRATLWVFQLTAGEDCEGRPLNGDLVAQAPASPPQATVQPERAAASAPGAHRASAPTAAPVARVDHAEAPVEPAATRSSAATGRARPAAPGSAEPAAQGQRPTPAQPAPQGESTTVVARPAMAPPAATGEGEVERRGKQPQAEGGAATKTAAARRPAASDGKVERGPEGALVITFATNSSFFPSGAARGLRELVAGIDPESQYQVTLQVAVSGTTKVAGARSAREAARYNRWLADRRLERVQNWLAQNAAADGLSITPEYVSDNESRQVIVRLAPIG